ncbi:MAG: hypothetical protein MUF87_07145 [Anaerolineae bacterium]|jgi:hypothetical protein|nr:hypothetical protein [Anaerolineae bacterium]
MLPTQHARFEITFANGNTAGCIRVNPGSDPQTILTTLGIFGQTPTIFITGGASQMSQEDLQKTREIMAMVAQFAQDQGATVIDGGTESGVMQMIGEARKAHGHRFNLIGTCPWGKIAYPGYQNPEEEAQLDSNHSHFVLVEGNEWGDESEMILQLTHAISGHGKMAALGILINGGRIAKQEVYLAATKQYKLPILVLEGSGRFADEIATAFKTGRANQRIIQAILAGGDIQLISTNEGAEAIREKLSSRFKRE